MDSKYTTWKGSRRGGEKGTSSKSGTSSLQRADVQRSDLRLYTAITFSMLCILLSFFWMLFHIGGDHGTILFADFAYAATSLLGAAWAFRVVFKSRRGPLQLERRHELAWFLIGIGLLMNSLGGLYYAYLESIGMAPFPSYADIGFTLFYPFVLSGLLIMPTSLRFRVRMGLDAIITTLCLFGISWFFVIGPAYFSHVAQASTLDSLLALLLGLSYPCWDIAVIFALLLLLQRRSQPILYATFLLIGLGIFSLAWADAAYAYTNIFTGTYQSGTPSIDPFWFISYLLIGLAALGQYNVLLHQAYSQRVQGTEAQLPALITPFVPPLHTDTVSERRLQSLLIYIPLVVLLGLTVYGETVHDSPASHYLVILSAIVGILVTMRYMFATGENEQLSQEMGRNHQQSELLRRLNTQLTGILDTEELLEHIVDMTIHQLHFDAAILLLLEDWATGTQSPFRVHASSAFGEMKKWRFHGNSFLSYLLFGGKPVDIQWDAIFEDTPSEIYQWRQEERLTGTYCIPLIYQGHTLGCLGVSYRKRRVLKESDIAFAQAYAEQISAIIEHVLLYKEAQEHEIFSRAMANIATRLNAAVVKPEDIYQLICSEGASALQADYALLYVPDEPGEQDFHGKLVPLAAYEVECVAQGNEWPIVHIHEPVAKAFNSLQPILMHVSSPSPSPMPTSSSTDARNLWEKGTFYPQNTPSRSLRVREFRASPEVQPLSLLEKLEEHNVQTVILAPLLSAGEPVGMLVFARSVPLGMYDKQSFGNESLSLAQDFAEQAAVALTNAHLYQHLRSTHQRLQELDELKDQFMITASHELRTPLTSVQGYIELLTQYDGMISAEERHEFLQKAQRSCNELVVLLGNVMDASRIENESSIRPQLLERVDVREMLESVITIINPQLRQEHRIATVHVAARLFVQADPVRLRQVLMNLSVNALKYSPQRTPIIFTARPVESNNGAMPSVIISVSDKGKGIAPEDQSRLFQRFSRLESEINSSIRGSGLGLYISRRLIELMSGRIWVESSGVVGEGSTFHVQLPTPNM